LIDVSIQSGRPGKTFLIKPGRESTTVSVIVLNSYAKEPFDLKRKFDFNFSILKKINKNKPLNL
jgi:hypothetical protein